MHKENKLLKLYKQHALSFSFLGRTSIRKREINMIPVVSSRNSRWKMGKSNKIEKDEQKEQNNPVPIPLYARSLSLWFILNYVNQLHLNKAPGIAVSSGSVETATRLDRLYCVFIYYLFAMQTLNCPKNMWFTNESVSEGAFQNMFLSFAKYA